MIKLLEILLEKYVGEECIYLSWDAASWHISKELYTRVEEINSSEYREEHEGPMVKLAPLPASAQFLNVIESVFSGMAKAILHNSDYASTENLTEPDIRPGTASSFRHCHDSCCVPILGAETCEGAPGSMCFVS